MRGAPEMCFTWVGSCLTCKHYTILKRLVRNEHSSLLQNFVTYARKKFYTIGPRTPIGLIQYLPPIMTGLMSIEYSMKL